MHHGLCAHPRLVQQHDTSPSPNRKGNVIAWSSAGGIGFKGSRKGTPLAALQAAISRLRRRERRALARALEADAAGARPRHDVALGVGDRHRRVVERGVDVRQPVVDDALLAALLERLLLAGRRLLPSLGWPAASIAASAFAIFVKPSSSSRSRPCAGPCACARWSCVRWPRTGRSRRCRMPR